MNNDSHFINALLLPDLPWLKSLMIIHVINDILFSIITLSSTLRAVSYNSSVMSKMRLKDGLTVNGYKRRHTPFLPWNNTSFWLAKSKIKLNVYNNEKGYNIVKSMYNNAKNHLKIK